MAEQEPHDTGTSYARAHRQSMKIHPLLAEARPRGTHLDAQSWEGCREQRLAQMLQTAFKPWLPQWWMLAVCWEMAPTKCDTGDLQERRLQERQESCRVRMCVCCYFIWRACPCRVWQPGAADNISSWFLALAHHWLDTDIKLKGLRFLDWLRCHLISERQWETYPSEWCLHWGVSTARAEQEWVFLSAIRSRWIYQQLLSVFSLFPWVFKDSPQLILRSICSEEKVAYGNRLVHCELEWIKRNIAAHRYELIMCFQNFQGVMNFEKL